MCFAIPKQSSQACHFKLKGMYILNRHNKLKNPNWWEEHSVAIYKHDNADELGSTEKQLLSLSGQFFTLTPNTKAGKT